MECQVEQARRILADGDAISSDGHMLATEALDGVVYSKRDYLFRSGRWRGRSVTPAVLAGRSNSVLVVGHGDWQTGPTQQLMLKIAGFRAVRGMNVSVFGRFGAPFPIGLTNHCNDSPIHPLLGSTEHFLTAHADVRRPRGFSGTVFVDFEPKTFPRERSPLLKLVNGEDGFLWRRFSLDVPGRLTYLSSMAEADFVLCPRGNGLDTHRIWEALYMGTYPIVRRHSMIEDLVSGLPVWVVDEWQECLPLEKRRRMWEDLSEGHWQWGKLRQSYWNAQLAELAREVRVA